MLPLSLHEYLDLDGWMQEPNPCKEYPTKYFFPTEGGFFLNRAKAVCAECPNRLTCLAYALDNNITYGVWGGMGERERQRIRRKSRREAV